MTSAPCGAQLETGPGRWAACALLPVDHAGRDHSDLSGHMWPACSQLCARQHVHGRYRRKAGINVGPKALASRAPKPERPSKGRRTQCRICLAEAELAPGGQCADREACESRMAPLFSLDER